MSCKLHKNEPTQDRRVSFIVIYGPIMMGIRDIIARKLLVFVIPTPSCNLQCYNSLVGFPLSSFIELSILQFISRFFFVFVHLNLQYYNSSVGFSLSSFV